MGWRLLIVFLSVFVLGANGPAGAAGKGFRLSAPDDLVQSGLLRHLLPRFSLKTQIRISLVGAAAPAEARLTEATEGRPAFRGDGRTWHLVLTDTADDHARRFADWLASDVGRKTIAGFRPDGKALFTAARVSEQEEETVALSGDAARGEQLSVVHCGRCHMVNEATRMSTIGSSPSFAVMRAFTDWQTRFEAFFALNPHPAFTIVDGVTEPFDESRPSPIVPLLLTLEDLDAILAFVSRIEPANLGAPIQYQ